MVLLLLVAAMTFWRCGGRGGDVVVPTASSTSTLAGQCRGRNPGVGLFLHSSTPM
jgi:hypothetical protein